MLDLAGGTTVYLACGATDLRKSYHGLAAIIKLKFKLDPYARCMFAFCNRRRTSIKILQWDGSGFWILMKRLDKDSFHWPDTPNELQKVTLKEMHWLCDGLSLTPKGAFEERHAAEIEEEIVIPSHKRKNAPAKRKKIFLISR